MKKQDIVREEFQDQMLQMLFQAMFTSKLFSGSKLVYKKLKTQIAREKIMVNMPIADMVKCSEEVLKKLGDLIAMPIGKKPILAAGYGSGFGNVNPAIVCIEFTYHSNFETSLEIAAYGKEGLINQKTAPKAIERYIAAMEELAANVIIRKL